MSLLIGVVYTVSSAIGGGYLAFMGISMVRDGGTLQLDDDTTNPAQSSAAIVRRGILLNVLNPKLTVFFFTFLPQFLDTTPRILDPTRSLGTLLVGFAARLAVADR